MEQSIKKMDVKEFREVGYLQEVNRRFFHPLGLALEIKIDDDNNYSLGGIWDYRDDPEGMLFSDLSDDVSIKNAERVERELKEKLEYRIKKFGFDIQPIGNVLPLSV